MLVSKPSITFSSMKRAFASLLLNIVAQKDKAKPVFL
jgi:hypothetical protein